MSQALIPYSNPYIAEQLRDDPRGEWRWAMVIAGLFFGLFLGWAAFTPLDSGAYARGVVEVAGNRQAVQHREGGIVTALFRKDGDLVTKGEALVRIASTDAEAEERGLASEYYLLVAQTARLNAERMGASTFAQPEEFTNLSGPDRLLAEQAYAAQLAMLRGRRGAVGAQKQVLGQRAAQANAQIGGLGAELRSNREQHRLVLEELEALKPLAERGYVAKPRLRALERAAAELDGNYGQQNADIARTREMIGEQRMQMASLDSQTLKEVDRDLREVALRLNEVRPRLSAVREQVARAVVRAPVAGRLVASSVFTVGGVVAPGQTLMEIVPQDRELVIKAQFQPDDADDIRSDMETKVRFPSIHGVNLPALDGRLTRFSADALTDEKTGRSYFTGEVRVPASELDKVRRMRPGSAAVRPGLPAEILVPVAKRTVLEYLLDPIIRSFWRTGREQ